jgi:hypothetical protein
MTFTYAGTLTTDLDLVRFHIGDTADGDGPRPGSTSNYTDAELEAIITAEGGWGRASARMLEVLSNEWTAEAGRVAVADYSEDYTKRAELYAERARELRLRYGGRRATTQPSVTRVDGFSDDVSATET